LDIEKHSSMERVMDAAVSPGVDVADESGPNADATGTGQSAAVARRRGALSLGWVPKAGVWAWSFVGLVVAALIVAAALAAVSEVVLPLTFAAVLAVIFRPTVGYLERHRLRPTIAAGVVVLGLLAVMAGVVAAIVRGVSLQADQISESVDAALDKAVAGSGVDVESLEAVREAVQDAAPMITGGLLTEVLSGISTLTGVAVGLILGSLIMYYLLKDGARVRSSVVAQFDPRLRSEIDDFLDEAGRTLRRYGRGRTIMSAIVSVTVGIASLLLSLPLVITIVVVNFVGGYIPYIGAFVGGGLAVIIAVGDGGLRSGVVMLVVVLAANLVLENFVEPKVMGASLDIHPLVVLVVTALGGLLGGIVGLILAVPATVIVGDAIVRLRSSGLLDHVTDQAEPTARRLLS
jgi:putative heme transporter